jgi:hypothetical protein
MGSYCALLSWAEVEKGRKGNRKHLMPLPKPFHLELELSAFISLDSWTSIGCPWQFSPRKSSLLGWELGPGCCRVWRPLLILICLPLGTCSAKNKLSENHIFGLKVKNAAFPPSGKHWACQHRAHFLEPSSHSGRRQIPARGSREEVGGEGKERRKVPGRWCGNQQACLCWSSLDWNWTGQEMKGK